MSAPQGDHDPRPLGAAGKRAPPPADRAGADDRNDIVKAAEAAVRALEEARAGADRAFDNYRQFEAGPKARDWISAIVLAAFVALALFAALS